MKTSIKKTPCFVKKLIKMTLPRKWPSSPAILKRIKKTVEPAEGGKYLVNRNPRNLEFLRIAYKPAGYELDKPGRCFWNK